MAKAKNALSRDYKVVKHNDLIQKSRYELSMQEQKIILYLITKIKPEDDEFEEYEFNIKDFCEVCGINTSGKNYTDLKDTILNLVKKAFWLKLEDESIITARWIDRSQIIENSGIIKIKLDELMRPYLLKLKEHFTAYNLYYTLAMKSKYSIRFYELLKSYENLSEYTVEIEELKKMLFAEKYELFGDLKRNVLDTAVREINDYSDISVAYTVEKEGRKVNKIHFKIKPKKDEKERMETFKKIENILNPNQVQGQLNLFENQKGENEYG